MASPPYAHVSTRLVPNGRFVVRARFALGESNIANPRETFSLASQARN
jgi:hypothetical protein